MALFPQLFCLLWDKNLDTPLGKVIGVYTEKCSIIFDLSFQVDFYCAHLGVC